MNASPDNLGPDSGKDMRQDGCEDFGDLKYRHDSSIDDFGSVWSGGL